MKNRDYRNPLAKFFQYEYALFMFVADFFRRTRCDSMIIRTLELYYAELVSENRETGHASYERQYRIEDRILRLIDRDLAGKIIFPGMDICKAEVTIRTEADGLHTFFFSDGIYGFGVGLELEKKTDEEGEERTFLKGLRFTNLSPSVVKGVGKEKVLENSGKMGYNASMYAKAEMETAS